AAIAADKAEEPSGERPAEKTGENAIDKTPEDGQRTDNASSSALRVTPHLDFYYSWNFNEPFPPTAMNSTTVSTATMPLANSPLRTYDGYHNQFSLALAEITVEKSFGSTSLLADFDFGHTADFNARVGRGPSRIIDPTRHVDESSKHIGQALVRWAPPGTPGLEFEAGKMLTHMGIETYKARDNWHYSRGLIYGFGLPKWHTGIRAGYAPDPSWSALLALYNGWDEFFDANAAKTLGAKLTWNPADNFRVGYAFIGGAEQDNESMNQRHVHELNIVWRDPTGFALALDSIYGFEQNVAVSGMNRDLVTWSGWALHGEWRLSDWYHVNPRLEWYNDNHGATLGNGEQKVWSATITEVYRFADGIHPRVELRYDKTSADGTLSRKGAAVTDQVTFTLALVYAPGTF
ncbi:MAG TPA: outer membrane beta-barrel protein, partial [Bdellovibrionales bacterium]|nr:outer membrane beta-barrel protein [Bdellovibrionales bacterium]